MIRVHTDKTARYYNTDTLAEYANCPMRYKLSYIDNISEKRSSKDKAVTKKLKQIEYKHGAEQVVIEFARQLASGIVISRRDFRNMLGKQWYGKKNMKDFLVEPLETGERLETEAITFMDRVYDSLAGISGIVAMVHVPYKVLISKHCPGIADEKQTGHLGLYGTMPILTRTSAESYTIVLFADDIYPAWITPIQAIAVDYRAQAISYAFRSTYRIMEAELHIIDFARLTTSYVQCDRRHYMRLKTLTEHMAFSEKRGFPPLPSDRCASCGYKKICLI